MQQQPVNSRLCLCPYPFLPGFLLGFAPMVDADAITAGSGDLVQSADSRCNHVLPRAAQEKQTILIGVAFKNRHDIDKALERSEFKNGGSLSLLRCQSFANALEDRRLIILPWPWVDDSHRVLNDRPSSP